MPGNHRRHWARRVALAAARAVGQALIQLGISVTCPPPPPCPAVAGPSIADGEGLSPGEHHEWESLVARLVDDH